MIVLKTFYADHFSVFCFFLVCEFYIFFNHVYSLFSSLTDKEVTNLSFAQTKSANNSESLPKTTILDLPYATLVEIFLGYLNFNDLITITAVCRRFRRIRTFNTTRFWNVLIRRYESHGESLDSWRIIAKENESRKLELEKLRKSETFEIESREISEGENRNRIHELSRHLICIDFEISSHLSEGPTSRWLQICGPSSRWMFVNGATCRWLHSAHHRST